MFWNFNNSLNILQVTRISLYKNNISIFNPCMYLINKLIQIDHLNLFSLFFNIYKMNVF